MLWFVIFQLFRISGKVVSLVIKGTLPPCIVTKGIDLFLLVGILVCRTLQVIISFPLGVVNRGVVVTDWVRVVVVSVEV